MKARLRATSRINIRSLLSANKIHSLLLARWNENQEWFPEKQLVKVRCIGMPQTIRQFFKFTFDNFSFEYLCTCVKYQYLQAMTLVNKSLKELHSKCRLFTVCFF